MVKKNPRLNANMAVTLSHYVKRFASLIEDLSLKEVPSRIARYLLDLSVKQSREAKSSEDIEIDLSSTTGLKIRDDQRNSIEELGEDEG